jgi:hypothetical protein
MPWFVSIFMSIVKGNSMVSSADHLWSVKETIAIDGRLLGHYTHGIKQIALY